MARKNKDKLKSPDVRGAKYLGKVLSLLERLHDDVTARDKARNRTLFYDQYAALVLLSMFSRAMDWLRVIQQASASPPAPPAARRSRNNSPRGSSDLACEGGGTPQNNLGR